MLSQSSNEISSCDLQHRINIRHKVVPWSSKTIRGLFLIDYLLISNMLFVLLYLRRLQRYLGFTILLYSTIIIFTLVCKSKLFKSCLRFDYWFYTILGRWLRICSPFCYITSGYLAIPIWNKKYSQIFTIFCYIH